MFACIYCNTTSKMCSGYVFLQISVLNTLKILFSWGQKVTVNFIKPIVMHFVHQNRSPFQGLTVSYVNFTTVVYVN